MCFFKNLKIFITVNLFFFVLLSLTSKANEVKILMKIENDIITNIDVENEYNYLISLNNSLRGIDKKKVMQFAQESLVKEKIKKVEILNFYELNNKNETVDLLIENIYKNLSLNSVNEFKNYLKNNNLKFEEVYKKIEIEAVWNQMIYSKYKDKIFIDEEALKKKISNNKKKNEVLLLSEIIVSLENKNEIEKKYNEIINYINLNGFKEAVLKFSISESRNNSGLLTWVNNDSLSIKIQDAIKDLKIGEVSKPILISSGILILKIEDRKMSDSNSDPKKELEKLISFEMNNQLNNFSSIYFNKIKKNMVINEY